MDSAEREDWLADPQTRITAGRIEKRCAHATQTVLTLARTGTLEAIRVAAGRRDGLMEALREISGGKHEEADGET